MSDLGREDRIDAIVQQLTAMLTMTCGEGGESFRMMADNIQDHYMWACADMARELQNLVLGANRANQGMEADHG